MRCAMCGNEALPGQQFCAQHRGLPGERAIGTADVYASFWQRLGGLVIDYLIVAIGLSILAAILIPAAPDFGGLLVLIAAVAYYVGFESSPLQGTPGKLAMSIKVTDLEGERIGVGRALGRYVGKIISWLILGIGFIMAAFTGRRQGLHDLMAGTLIARKALAPAQIAGAGPAQSPSAGTVIAVIAVCLFFGVFLVGMISAISIPAYQDYTIRAQAQEGLNLAAAARAAVADAYRNGRPFNEITTESLGLREGLTGTYVQSVEVVNGAVAITYGGRANNKLAQRVLMMHPAVSQTNEIVWVCGRSAAPADARPVLADAAQYTTVDNKYLPRHCRAN
jgi:uncharacterized RDD family membrane protein YckC/Tfp pilus assembly major pilin PilA